MTLATYFYMLILLSIPSIIFVITMFILIWQNKIDYQSRKIRFIIGGIEFLIVSIISISDVYLLHFGFHLWIAFLQAAPMGIVNGIMYFKYVDKNGDFITS